MKSQANIFLKIKIQILNRDFKEEEIKHKQVCVYFHKSAILNPRYLLTLGNIHFFHLYSHFKN
jgi:hypothetical protein